MHDASQAAVIGHSSQDDDTHPLLQDQEDASCDYGGTADPNNKSNDTDSDSEDEDNIKVKQRRAELLKARGGWLAYLRDFKIFLPYIVPKHDRKVQLCYLACIACISTGRILNILLPLQIGKVADQLLDKNPPYRALALWLLLSFARYDPGLDLIQALVKIPIENFSYRGLTNAAFSHIMSLSVDFYVERDAAEVIAAVEQGQAITNLLSTLMLEILPTCLDLIIALVYLSRKFDPSVAIALSVAMIVIISAEAIGLSWNLDRRRKMSKTSRQQATAILQAVQGWQTVWFFNMFSYERHRFGQAVKDQLAAKRSWSMWNAIGESILGSLIPATFFILACLIIHEISLGRATPGDFVFLIQYWDYLTWPVSMLSHNCKFLMSDFVDAERLLHLMQIQPSIKTHETAIDITVKGRVAFEDVRFSYDPKQTTLRDLSFDVSPGQTTALVGETGAGKSSIMKMLLRLYDVTDGRISIDGHDIRDLTLDSLRTAIGVVPQAPLLFNGTVLENLRYAKLDATDAEVQEACQAAAIHDKILTFADGYNTKVGEQGVKLSGGEVQRLAIARVFLKDPPILILDEATSAVDSITEQTVQTALDHLRSGRTTLVIAHRLSTVVKADQILVIHDGRIAEQGRHQELLQLNGRYNRMWEVQSGAGAEMTSLPPDVLHLVFDQLEGDTIRNVGLTCHAWRSLSLSSIYRNVDLSYHNIGDLMGKGTGGGNEDDKEATQRYLNGRMAYTAFRASVRPINLVHRQRAFLRTITTHPELAKHVKSLTWTLVWQYREDSGLTEVDRQTWNVSSQINNVTKVDLASLHDIHDDEFVRQNPSQLFPAVVDLKLIGWMHRGLVIAILASMNTARLRSLTLDYVQDEGALPDGSPMGMELAEWCSSELGDTMGEPTVVSQTLIDRQESGKAFIFPGPMWLPLHVLSTARLDSLTHLRVDVPPLTFRVNQQNYVTLFRKTADLITAASASLRSLIVILGDAQHLPDDPATECGTGHLRLAEAYYQGRLKTASSYLYQLVTALSEHPFPLLEHISLEGFDRLEAASARAQARNIERAFGRIQAASVVRAAQAADLERTFEAIRKCPFAATASFTGIRSTNERPIFNGYVHQAFPGHPDEWERDFEDMLNATFEAAA